MSDENNQKAKSQLDKFKDAARELETDDNEDRFKERLKAISRPHQVKEK